MIKVIDANEAYYKKWDEFIQKLINGTIFNSIKFLIILKNNTLIDQITIFINNANGKNICLSPYGASYGGVILQRQPKYSEGKSIISDLIEYLRQNKISEFILTQPINCCSNVSLDTFYFNMLEQGFKVMNQEISSVVEFNDTSIEKCIMSKTRNRIRFAEKSGLK